MSNKPPPPPNTTIKTIEVVDNPPLESSSSSEPMGTSVYVASVELTSVSDAPTATDVLCKTESKVPSAIALFKDAEYDASVCVGELELKVTTYDT